MPRSWETFASTVGLASVEPEASAEVPAPSRLKKLALGAAVALGLLVVAPGLGTAVRAASVCGLAALTPFVHKKCSKTAKCQSTKRSNASHSKETSRWSREDEPGPNTRWSRENEPGPIALEHPRPSLVRSRSTVGRTGTPTGAKGLNSPCSHGRMRMCAMKAPPHVGLGTGEPWELARFTSPPTGNDRWECLGCGSASGEWWVRVLKKSRVRQFHPLHRGTPMSIGRLSPTRITVAFSRGSTREAWVRKLSIDDWVENRNSDLKGCYEWCGYSLLREVRP